MEIGVLSFNHIFRVLTNFELVLFSFVPTKGTSTRVTTKQIFRQEGRQNTNFFGRYGGPQFSPSMSSACVFDSLIMAK